MQDIKISIVIPVYNTSKFLNKCLDSVINQDIQEIEIICVNDGSTDNSLEILEQYKIRDERIIIVNKNNGGLSSARNKGISISKGKYILHLDSDDWLENQCLKSLYDYAEENNYDIVSFNFYREFLSYRNEIKIFEFKNREFDSKEYLQSFLEEKEIPAIWNKLIKSKIYKENNIEHPLGINLGEDLATTPRLIYFSKKIGYLDKVYYHYRYNIDSITGIQNGSKRAELFEVFNRLEKFFIDKNLNRNLLYLIFLKKIGNFYMYNFEKENLKYQIGCKLYISFIKDTRFKLYKNKIKFSERIFIEIIRIFPSVITIKYISYLFENYRKLKRSCS